MGDIGEDQCEYEFEPVEAPAVPVVEPAPAPEPELVPT